MNGRIGAVLGNPTAGIWYQNKGATQSLSFYVEARDVLAIKGQVIVYGFINSDNSYSFNVAATAGPWSGSQGTLPRANSAAPGTTPKGQFSGSITGTRDSLAISFTGNINVGASCGTISSASAPRSASPTRHQHGCRWSVKLSLNFGVTSWNPTIFSFTQG